MESIVTLFLICLSAIHAMQTDMQKVNVKVYFDTMSIISMKFFEKQLEPVYKELGAVMTIDPIAYGAVTKDGDEFICKHGKNECLGNEMMLCAREHALTKDKLYNFAFCVMKSENPSGAARKCANDVQKGLRLTDTCLQNGESKELMKASAEMKEKEEDIPQKRELTIMFDDKYSREDEKEARKDLKKVICDKFEEKNGSQRPLICDM